MLVDKTSLDLIRSILVKEMALDPEHVMIYDENFKIPSYRDMFIAVEYKSATVLSVRSKYNDLTDKEEQDINMKEEITLSIMSRDSSAFSRKEECLLALSSMYSQQLMEANSFKIFPQQNITDLSQVEGAAIIKRFDINLVAFTWYNKTKAVEFYDSFNGEIWDKEATLLKTDFVQPVA